MFHNTSGNYMSKTEWHCTLKPGLYVSEWTILNECKIKDMKCIAVTVNAQTNTVALKM